MSGTDQIYHRAAKRLGDKFDRSMTRGKLLDNDFIKVSDFSQKPFCFRFVFSLLFFVFSPYFFSPQRLFIIFISILIIIKLHPRDPENRQQNRFSERSFSEKTSSNRLNGKLGIMGE